MRTCRASSLADFYGSNQRSRLRRGCPACLAAVHPFGVLSDKRAPRLPSTRNGHRTPRSRYLKTDPQDRRELHHATGQPTHNPTPHSLREKSTSPTSKPNPNFYTRLAPRCIPSAEHPTLRQTARARTAVDEVCKHPHARALNAAISSLQRRLRAGSSARARAVNAVTIASAGG